MKSALLAAVAAAVLAIPPMQVQQGMTGYAYADSATVARAAFRAASAAMRANDLATARKEVARAASAWPTQEAYVWAAAVLAVNANDTGGVIAALGKYADAGFGKDVRGDKRFAPYVAAAAAAIARIDANRAPRANSTVVATLPDSTFWPEGMDYDAKGKRFFVASVYHRTIAEVDASGRVVRELIPRRTARIGAIFGVRVDTARGLLWATTSGLKQMDGYAPADSAIAALLRIRLSDGTIEKRWDIAPSANGHVLGDLALGPNGDVWFTDSVEPVLYRLRSGADTLEHDTHPLYRSLQGIAPTPDGRALYVADYSHGLLRVDLPTFQVTRVADAGASSSLGCDGIVFHRGAIIAVQNGSVPRRIMRYALDATGTRITRADVIDQNLARADEPTIGALMGDEFVYVANAQWDKYDDNGTRISGTSLGRSVLLGVRLPH